MKQLKITHVFNYQITNVPRKDKTGGGICEYVHNSLLFKLRQDLSHSDDNNESIVVEIINKNSKKYYCWYNI